MLPDKKRPSEFSSSSIKKKPTPKKSAAKKTKAFEDGPKPATGPLEKIREEVKTIQEKSKTISKPSTGTGRQNFVRINQMKNYKPALRGAAFSNKIMAKKRNVMKFRENFKRKMQIERAKNRSEVDVYGGLGKVGMDH